MACIIDSGLKRGCRNSSGGLYTFYVGNFDDDITTKDATGMVTGFTTGATFDGFYEFTPNKNSGQFTEEYQISLENGSHGFSQKVVGNFSRMDQEKQNLMDMLSTGTFVVAAKDKNGNYFLMGENDGVVMGGGSASSGLALADLSGYALELVAEEGSPAPQIDESAITAVII